MRVGMRAGPVYASTGTKGCLPVAVTFIAMLTVVSLAIDYPQVSIPVGVLIVGVLVRGVQQALAVRRARRAPAASDAAVRDVELGRCAWCGREAGRHWTDCPTALPTGRDSPQTASDTPPAHAGGTASNSD